jgi:hypothetical protein
VTGPGRQSSAPQIGRWLFRTFVGGTALGVCLFAVYLLVAMFR